MKTSYEVLREMVPELATMDPDLTRKIVNAMQVHRKDYAEQVAIKVIEDISEELNAINPACIDLVPDLNDFIRSYEIVLPDHATIIEWENQRQEEEKLLNASPEEVDEYLRAEGYDPEKLALKGVAFIKGLIEKHSPS